MYLTDFGLALYASPLKWVVMLAPLAFVFFLSFRVYKMSVGAARARPSPELPTSVVYSRLPKSCSIETNRLMKSR
jgi:hypothetical protein